MSDAWHIEKYNGYTIELYQDSDPYDPREWSNTGIMVCSHRNYSLGDEQLNSDDFNGWDEVKIYLQKEKGAIVILPLYLYDHSGITMNTEPFSCRWDSGQVGFIYATRNSIKEIWGYERLTSKRLTAIVDALKSEVKTYDAYISGLVFGYKIFSHSETEETNGIRMINVEDEIDSCFGFYERDHAIEEAKAVVDEYIK